MKLKTEASFSTSKDASDYINKINQFYKRIPGFKVNFTIQGIENGGVNIIVEHIYNGSILNESDEKVKSYLNKMN